MSVAEFVLAHVAEDEAVARAAGASSAPMVEWADYTDDAMTALLSAWQPARVLAECAAKRAIVTLHAPAPPSYPDADPFPFGCPICHFDDNIQFGYGPCETVLTLARVWSDHPEFDPAWAS